MYNAYSPDRSLKYDSVLPSGDHAGSRSAEPLELVRLRTSPFSAGMVKISPRASTATRLPVGESARLLMFAVTSFHCAIIHGKSPAAVMLTTCSLPDFGSSRWMSPACSKTTALPSDAASSAFTSKSLKLVTCAIFFVFVSYVQTFATPSRSEMKSIASLPIQTGSTFLDSGVVGAEKCDELRGDPACATTRSLVPFGVVSRSNVLRSTIQIGRFCPPR